jgi:hypothetical protein
LQTGKKQARELDPTDNLRKRHVDVLTQRIGGGSFLVDLGLLDGSVHHFDNLIVPHVVEQTVGARHNDVPLPEPAIQR